MQHESHENGIMRICWQRTTRILKVHREMNAIFKKLDYSVAMQWKCKTILYSTGGHVLPEAYLTARGPRVWVVR